MDCDSKKEEVSVVVERQVNKSLKFVGTDNIVHNTTVKKAFDPPINM